MRKPLASGRKSERARGAASRAKPTVKKKSATRKKAAAKSSATTKKSTKKALKRKPSTKPH